MNELHEFSSSMHVAGVSGTDPSLEGTLAISLQEIIIEGVSSPSALPE